MNVLIRPTDKRLSLVRLSINFLFALSSIHYVSAQTNQLKFKHLNISNGLSHHEINSIFKDSRGFVWISTAYGLNRFDGRTVKSFLHDAHDSTSLIGNWVVRVFEAPDGSLCVLTLSGLTLYDSRTESFQHNLELFYAKYGTSKDLVNIVRGADDSFWFVEPYRLIHYSPSLNRSYVFQSKSGESSSILNDPIKDLAIASNGGAWVIHSNGIAEKLEVLNDRPRVAERMEAVSNFNKGKQGEYRLHCDSAGDLWIGCPYFYQGIFYYSPKSKEFVPIHASTQPIRLNTNLISDFTEDENGNIWVGTDHGGINIIDKKNRTVRYVQHQDENPLSLSENSITCFYRDNQGIIWLGTYKRGVSYYHESIYRFDVYKHYSLNPASLPFEDVNRFEEDDKGNIWIGTNGGGLLYFDRLRQQFKQYKNEPGNPNSLSANVIVSLCRDSEGNLWIGTYNGGLDKFDGRKFTRYQFVEGDTTALASRNIWELFEDSKKRLWIGTLDAGVSMLDKKRDKFKRLPVWIPNGLQSTIIDAIAEDQDGNIWFGTTNGIDVLSPDGKFKHYTSSINPNSLSNNSIHDIKVDAKGRIWIATMDGLNLYTPTNDGFKTFKENLPHKEILTLQIDSNGKIWMSTLNGLCEMTLVNDDVSNVTLRHYDEADGLQGLQFNLNASFKTNKGELLFGGPTGFNLLPPGEEKKILPLPRVIFSGLQLYQKPVGIGEEVNGVVVLKESMSSVDEIVFPPNKNFFSIQFSSLDYINPEKNQYLYKLEGLQKEWLPVNSKTHEVTFNGLNPGQYTLRVKVANSQGVWSAQDAVLQITMQPPWWKTRWAFMSYAFLLIAILYIGRNIIQQRERLKFAIKQEREEIQRVHELDMMKVKFFTNVSHEFRTPLALILAPIERLIKRTTDSDQLSQFQMIQRNGRRLLNLVNQLLDYKKLEVQEIKFNPTKGEIVEFVKDIVNSFSDLSEKKHIKLDFQSRISRLETPFDHDKLEKILFNLLSNAFKFTLENGVVSVSLDTLDNNNKQSVQIKVCDTGIGIPTDKLEKIFEPFFQNEVPGSIVNQGSGIGLSITKEFVRVHGGTIKVESELGKGSCFTMLLPVNQMHGHEPEHTQIVEPESANGYQIPVQGATNINGEGAEQSSPAKKKLLLVEDNDDFRFYLKDNLKFQYTIFEARNGSAGWDQLIAVEPDLVVSDIMMPEMNGIDLCAKIKGDERVSHTPVILLTARSSEEQQLEGLQTGADDYITKPFNFEILESRIANLLKRREIAQRKFRQTLDVKASKLEITPLDVKFVENAIKCVEQHVSSPDFSVDDLGVELGISRAYVFKKIQALTGKSPLEFIRSIRLQHAAQLLEKSQLSVREIAYKVGFNNPKYFTKYFKEYFHVLPSNYAASKENEKERDGDYST